MPVFNPRDVTAQKTSTFLYVALAEILLFPKLQVALRVADHALGANECFGIDLSDDLYDEICEV
jgi:hypothetical protein